MNRPKKYRKKTAVIEAMQWLGPNGSPVDVLLDWGANVQPGDHWDAPHWPLRLRTLNGDVDVFVGDWIIKGAVSGDFYPCRMEIFRNLFEPAEEYVERTTNG